MLKNSKVLITGGTGSFGKMCTKAILEKFKPQKLIIFSRDELKQHEMQLKYNPKDYPISYFIGDVRDKDRLYRAFDGVDYVVHAAALKQVPACERNPFEAVKTNVLGAENIINAAIDRGVKRVIALSTDKAANPVNLYGATKLCSDKLFISGNSYSGSHKTRFSVVRYGNVAGSRGSVIPLFLKLRKSGVLPITDPDMTRFWITLEHGVDFVLSCLELSQGGELFVPKIPSMKISDLAKAIAPECKHEIIGARPGEKLHEVLISESDSSHTIEFNNYYVIQPEFKWWSTNNGYLGEGSPVPKDFIYSSDKNSWWLTPKDITAITKKLDDQ